MSKSNLIRYFLYAIVLCNLGVLLAGFIFPRLALLTRHASATSEQLTELPGPKDMPNIHYRSFALANRIAERTPESAVIFIPESAGEQRSPFVRRLYPRKIIWEGTPEFEKSSNTMPETSFAVMEGPAGKNLCLEPPIELVPGGKFFLCLLRP